MDPFSTAASLGAALKAAMDITEGLLASDGSEKFNSKILQLQAVILNTQRQSLNMQEAQYNLLQEKRALELKIATFESWNLEKSRYELKPVKENGALAFLLKADAANGEPEHWICPDCYQASTKSILKPETIAEGRVSLLYCHACGAELFISGIRQPSHHRTPPRKVSKPSKS